MYKYFSKIYIDHAQVYVKLLASRAQVTLGYRMSNIGSVAASLLAFILGVCLPLLQSELYRLDVLVLMFCLLVLVAAKVCCVKYLAITILGLFWATYQFSTHAQQSLAEDLQGAELSLVGTIEGLPVKRAGNIRFRLRLDRLHIKQFNIDLVGLTCYRCPLDLKTGQTWALTVRLKRPHGYASWGAFDSEKQLFRHRVSARGYLRLAQPNTKLANAEPSIALLRNDISARLAAMELGSAAGKGIISALSVGDKSLFSSDQRKVFQVTGVSHLMAISGLHVGLVFILIKMLFGFFLFPFARLYHFIPRQHLVLAPALLGALVYAALAGFSVSTQRAMLMLCVFVLCRLFVRECSLLKVLLISVTLLLVYDPFSVMDTGFWLSVGAVFIIAIASEGKAKLSLFSLQPLLWLGMLPMTALFFGQVSLISPLVNLVVVPLFSLLLIPLTLLGVLLLQLGSFGLGEILLLQLGVCYEFIFSALKWCSALPFAKLVTPEWSAWHWLLLVVAVGLIRVDSRLFVLSAGLFMYVLITAPHTNLNSKELEVTLLDVGQGLAMVLRTADYVLIYDTGPKYRSGYSAAEAVLLPYLRSKGVAEIDTLIISHADNDHIGGYQAVVDAFPVTEILTSRVDKLPDAENCSKGQSWGVGQTRFSIIGPEQATPLGSNNLSCVLLVEHLGTRILITGDIEKQVERYMLETPSNLNADILLVPHQGSKTSSTVDFIDAVQPELALVAAGYRNHYGHPHASVTQRYTSRNINLASTVENGSILLKINAHGWQKTSYRIDHKRFWNRQIVPNWER